MDLQVEVPALDPSVLRGPREPRDSTAEWSLRIERARTRQLERNARCGGKAIVNAHLADNQLERACGNDAEVEDAIERVLRLTRAGGRARVRLLRVARTLADLDDRQDLRPEDALEAAALRGFARAPMAV